MKWLVNCFLLICFVLNSALPVTGQSLSLPSPQQGISLSERYTPCLLKGLKLDTREPLRFQFLVDEGDSSLKGEGLSDQTNQLVKYFLATLTTPESDLWVNLSPFENNRIIQDDFGRTAMGRDLLAQDYVLKQLTAALLHPDSAVGKIFWKEIYKRAYERFGTTDIPVDTFNKVWIMPQRADVFESREGDGRYVAAVIDGARLKVLLESDYLAQKASQVTVPDSDAQGLARQIMREVIIPVLEREVNEGRHFAGLRQVYYSLLLGVWLKKKLAQAAVASSDVKTGSGSLLVNIFINKHKTGGIEIPNSREEVRSIYDQYVESFRKGAYNLIREDYDFYTREMIPRKYFSGGFMFGEVDSAMISHDLKVLNLDQGTRVRVAEVWLSNVDAAQKSAYARDKVIGMLLAGGVFVNSMVWGPQTIVAAGVSFHPVVQRPSFQNYVAARPMTEERMERVLTEVGEANGITVNEILKRFSFKKTKATVRSLTELFNKAYEMNAATFQKAGITYELLARFTLGKYGRESSLNPISHDGNGASGLGQITPPTWASASDKKFASNVYDPIEHTFVAVRLIASNLEDKLFDLMAQSGIAVNADNSLKMSLVGWRLGLNHPNVLKVFRNVQANKGDTAGYVDDVYRLGGVQAALFGKASENDKAQVGGIDLATDGLDMMLKGDAGQLKFQAGEGSVFLPDNFSGFVPQVLRIYSVSDVLGFMKNMEGHVHP